MRLALMAPYRCRDCGSRFSIFHGHPRMLVWSREESFAEFIGLRGRESAIRQWTLTALMALILVAISIALLMRITN